jgi:predicted Zn-dependent protease
VLIEKSSTNSVSVINGELENNQFSNKLGLGVRTILRGKTGYSYTEDFAERSLLKAVDYAIENAWVVESDDVAFLTNFPEEPFEDKGFKQELESIMKNI